MPVPSPRSWSQNLYETICTRAVNYACALTEELLDEG